MNIEAVREIVGAVPGLVDLKDELPLLHRLVSALRLRQIYFEIGTAGGRSALIAALSASGQADVEVWTVDNAWQQYDVARYVKYVETIYKRLAFYGALRRVRFCPLASLDMPWDGRPIDVLFIDGNHSPASIRDDVKKWTPYVPAGGIVAFHDAVVGDWPYYKGVTAAVARLLETGDWVQEEGARSIAVLRRVK